MKVLLCSQDRAAIHAAGELDTELLGGASLLRHNGRLYSYSGMKKGVALFCEVPTPWEVTGKLATGQKVEGYVAWLKA